MTERYEIQGKLGQGGVGAVYQAYDRELDRKVAIKRLVEEGVGVGNDGTSNSGGASIRKEASILSSLKHAGIVSVFDLGRDEDGPYLVMELIEGETLDQLVERGVLEEAHFRRFVIQILEALAYARENDLLHRDIKPSNLMLAAASAGTFQAKILDFGLAKVAPEPSFQTMDHAGAILGSLSFMAPEQFERIELDARTDLYSFGCVCYYALTGRHPFSGKSPAEVMNAHLYHKLSAPLAELRPDLPGWMCEWVERLMSRRMEERPEHPEGALRLFHAESAGAGATRSVPEHSPEVAAATAVQNPEASGATTTQWTVMATPTPRQPQLAAQAQAQAQAAAEHSTTSNVLPPSSVDTFQFPWLTALAGVGLIGGVLFFVLRGDHEARGGGPPPLSTVPATLQPTPAAEPPPSPPTPPVAAGELPATSETKEKPETGANSAAGAAEREEEEIFDAADADAMTGNVGEYVTVEGRVQSVGSTSDGKFLFVNFGKRDSGALSLVLPAERIPGYAEDTLRPLIGTVVRIKGTITEYKGRPQMRVVNPSRIQRNPK